MKSTLFAAAMLAVMPLTGCVIVDDDHDYDDLDAIAINTDTALRVCGGEGRVKEVTDDGFKCMDDD